MPLFGQEKSDEVSLFDGPQERARKIRIMQEKQAQDMESVRIVDAQDMPTVWSEVEEDAPSVPVLSEWDAYRVEGIVTMKEALVTARDSLQVAEQWSKQISVVPHDVIPLIRELAHKSKLVVDELKDLR